jgi:superfamily I DNA and RNA helicase
MSSQASAARVIDVTYGSTSKEAFARQLAATLRSMDLEGSLYIGYPVFATADEHVTVDALLVTHQHGLVVFYLGDQAPHEGDQVEWQKVRETLDRIYFAVETSLGRHDDLRDGRRLGVQPHMVAVFPSLDGHPVVPDANVATLTTLPGVLDELPELEDQYLRPLQAALQRITTIKPRKRRPKAITPRSRGSILKEIEKEIANLDRLQKQAAIESPEGPQRIRGLAGSGKTIVLALKAAYLHAQHPDWVIAVTFQTRSLYQQFQDLIRRFSFEQINDEPDWQNLRILHAWGGSGRAGVYSELASHAGLDPRDYVYGRSKYGRDQAFQGVCAEILSAVEPEDAEPIYDAVLIDEAQDLPPAFFQLAHRFTRPPKRIIWAYDELQRLSETTMPSLVELFGKDPKGESLISLTNTEGAQQDIVLRVCYRNPPWTLASAHALGLGIYREHGLVQHFDDPDLWTEIGYQVRQGMLEPGADVVLVRSRDASPEFFLELIQPTDAVSYQGFDDAEEQAAWIARSIKANIEQDELDLDDILVVLPTALTAQADARPITAALQRLGITSHLAGVTSSVDTIFTSDSIAIAHIHRSKGNEAAMVYVANAQQCIEGAGQVSMRNTLFTAMTRSRAWVRICGVGAQSANLQREIAQLVTNDYALRFKIPTPEQLTKIRQIHRELSASEAQRLRTLEKSLRLLKESLDRGEIEFEQLPLDLRGSLAKYFSGDDHDHYDG